MGSPYTNLDEIHWGPGWTERPGFRDEATALAATDQWITEWQYWSKGFKNTLGDRADTFIWLNFPDPSPGSGCSAERFNAGAHEKKHTRGA